MLLTEISPTAFRLLVASHADDNPRFKANIDLDGSFADHRCYLTADFKAGFAIAPDGELKAVFSLTKGRGWALIKAAVEMGAFHLNCFEGYLSELYAKHGFVIYHRTRNWAPGGPDVVYMNLVPK